MKKMIHLFLIILLFLFSCKVATETKNDRIKDGSWTILIHFAIDNDIDYHFENKLEIVTNYLNTLEDIERKDVYDKINIVVMMDCYNAFTNLKDGYYHLSGGDIADDLIIDKAEINSGSVEDTKKFMDWAISNYPASRYFYSIFNHGNGFEGDENDIKNQDETGNYSPLDNAHRSIGFDDRRSDSLSHKELQEVTSYLKKLIGKKIDIFYTYACLMGGIELAYEVQDNANYLLFSEESFPADLWSYEALENLVGNLKISPLELGSAFCDSANDYFTSLSPSRSFTLSLIDLAGIKSLYTSINNYSKAVIADIGNNSNAHLYNNIADNSLSMYDNSNHFYMDLGDYINNIITSNDINNNIKDYAQNVKKDLSNAVVYQRNPGYPAATGLTIFHNIWLSYYQYSLENYRKILSFSSNQWVNYLELLESNKPVIDPDSYEEDNEYTSAKSITIDGNEQIRTLHEPFDVDWISFTGESKYFYIINSNNSDDSITKYLYSENDTNNEILYAYDNDPLIFNCEENATYYLSVSSYAIFVGEYSISITRKLKPVRDIYENDNYSHNAKEIIVDGDSQDHTLHPDGWFGDVDWLFFSGKAGADYTITTNADDDILNIHLYQESDLFNEIEWGCVGQPITFHSTKNRDYYIEIDTYNELGGNYSIDVKTGIVADRNIKDGK